MVCKKWFLYILMALIALSLTGNAYSSVIKVKWDSPNNGPGNDWDHAYHTVTAGIAAASEGDEVWVAKGTYGKISLKLGVGLYGGFSGSETTRGERDIAGNATILDAGGVGSVVVSPSGATTTTIIDGFTIKNALGYSFESGGIFCSSSSPRIANNTITSNCYAGIYCKSSSPTIENNIIETNTKQGDGYGICCTTSSNPLVTNNTITSNPLSGIYCSNASLTASGNYIAGNACGILCQGNGLITITNNKMVGNRSSGIDCSMGSLNIINNMIWRNGGSL